MVVPLPQHDTVLLREHLYQDLKQTILVIPPESKLHSFKPANEVGLGLFNYALVDVSKVHEYGNHETPSHSPFLFYDLTHDFSITKAFMLMIFCYVIYRLISGTLARFIRKKEIISVDLEKQQFSLRSPFTNDKNSGFLYLSTLVSPSSTDFTANSNVPSLSNSPSSPSINEFEEDSEIFLGYPKTTLSSNMDLKPMIDSLKIN